jgi:uncharacterized membrane protein required for colicin V production
MQNILDLSRQLNWVDILIFIVFLRLSFISVRQGLGMEFFKFLGTFCGLYLSLHYYFLLAKYLNGLSASKDFPGTVIELLAFVLLFILGYLFMWSLRYLTFRFMTAEIDPQLSRWGGFAFGLLRALFLSSVILFALLLTKGEYFKDSVRYSFSGNSVSKVAPATYTFIWESIVSKFNFGEVYNSAVRDIYSTEAKQKMKNK